MNEVIDYTVMLGEIREELEHIKLIIGNIEVIVEYIKVLIVTAVSLNILDFIWKKIRQPKRIRGGVDE